MPQAIALLEKTGPLPAIHSSAKLQNAPDLLETGRVLVQAFADILDKPDTRLDGTLDLFLAIRDNALSHVGYGNLAIAYSAEAAAYANIARTLSKNKEPGAARKAIAQITDRTASPAYLAQVLRLENIVLPSSLPLDGANARRSLIQALCNREITGEPPPPSFFSKLDGTFDNRDFFALGQSQWTADIARTAILCACDMIEATGQLPSSASEFVKAVKAHASETLQNDSGILSGITPLNVWLYWDHFRIQ